MKAKSTILALTAAALMSGCVTDSDLSREDRLAGGAVLGAVAGGIIGYNVIGGSGSGQLLGMALGAGAGGVGGYWATDQLTRWDKTAMNETAYKGLNEGSSGQTLTWANEDSGHSGSFTPVRTFLDHQGRICREYVVTLEVDEAPREGRQTACRTATGDWIIL